MLVIRRSTGDVLGTHGLQRPGLVLRDVDLATGQLLVLIFVVQHLIHDPRALCVVLVRCPHTLRDRRYCRAGRHFHLAVLRCTLSPHHFRLFLVSMQRNVDIHDCNIAVAVDAVDEG